MEVKPGYKQTEVGVIPEEWEVIPLSKTAKRITRGASPRPIDSPVWFDARSSVGWVRISDVTRSGRYLLETTQRLSDAGIRRSRPVPSGSLIMSICATVGRPIETRINTCIHDGFVVFDQPTIDQSFLYHTLTDLEPKWSKHGQTGSQMNLNTGLINRCLIHVPPLPEQRAIATVLSDVDGLLGGLDRLIAKKRDLKQAAMQQLLTGQTRLPGFHAEWEVKRLGTLLQFQVGFPFSSAFFNEKGEGIRLVKNRDLKSDDQVFHYNGMYEEAFVIRDGDVLIGMDGDFLPCQWNKGPALLNQRVGRVVPNTGLNVAFAFYALIEPLKEIEIVTSCTTVKHLSHGDVEGIERPLPPLPEQTAIASVLTEMDGELAVLTQRREKTSTLKQAMMQELLTGKTRLI